MKLDLTWRNVDVIGHSQRTSVGRLFTPLNTLNVGCRMLRKPVLQWLIPIIRTSYIYNTYIIYIIYVYIRRYY